MDKAPPFSKKGVLSCDAMQSTHNESGVPVPHPKRGRETTLVCRFSFETAFPDVTAFIPKA